MKNYQQILVNYMMAKRELLRESKHEYFTNDDAIDLLNLSDRTSELIVEELIQNLEEELRKNQTHYIFYIQECPFCIIYYVIGCDKCTYGKKHGICENSDSTWNNLECRNIHATKSAVENLINILKGE